MTEIENIVSSLYEDKVAGNITFEMFNQLSRKYADEQTELKHTFENETATLAKISQKKVDIGKFIKTVKKYTQIAGLTPELPVEFIDKVMVHQSDKSSGKRKQQIDIYFKSAGKVDLC